MDCLFCKIAQKEIESDRLFEDDEIVAFRDINPQAPVHILIIPKAHISTINDVTPEQTPLLGKMVERAKLLAAEMDIQETGYRLVFNVNRGAGQDVFHIHLHLLGGRQMRWPPG